MPKQALRQNFLITQEHEMTNAERAELNRLKAKYPNMHPRILEAQFLNDRRQQRIALKQVLINIAATPTEIKSTIG